MVLLVVEEEGVEIEQGAGGGVAEVDQDAAVEVGVGARGGESASGRSDSALS
ncbi:hypothetical protein ACGFZP_32240 [Kitasatospora sp. NPDC048239]|uniref:hypothetical protein n=1 Tax=Kitasatospora sp. NPDC048239 TaxID=3364046 RepID=UPI0037116600